MARPHKTCTTTNCRKRPLGGILWCLLFALVIPLGNIQAQVQDIPSLGRPQSQPERSAFKVTPSADSARPNERPTSPATGMTYVALLPGLSKQQNPSTLEQLQALERQQSLVARKIEQVTVNVQQGSAQGSGVIITADGFVLTAAHVAGNANREASIMLSDGRRVRAITYGMNRNRDAGLMKIIDPIDGDWPHASLGQSSQLRPGEWVIAAGHPGGWKRNRGSVIRVGRVLKIKYESEGAGAAPTAHTLTTDCALIGGDSGGPLFNLEGKLVGIHSRIGTDVVENMHVPVDVFRDHWDRLVDKEVWGFLPGFRPAIGVSGTRGVEQPLISEVLRGSPAHRAGIEPGDLILKVDGKSISTFKELKEMVEMKMPGEKMVLHVRRGEQVLRIPLIVDTPD